MEISDSVTGALLAEHAHGVVRDSGYIDSLRPYAATDDSILAWRQAARHRAGTYDITVEHAGYAPWTIKGVKVSSDGCHANTVELKARLKRLP